MHAGHCQNNRADLIYTQLSFFLDTCSRRTSVASYMQNFLLPDVLYHKSLSIRYSSCWYTIFAIVVWLSVLTSLFIFLVGRRFVCMSLKHTNRTYCSMQLLLKHAAAYTRFESMCNRSTKTCWPSLRTSFAYPKENALGRRCAPQTGRVRLWSGNGGNTLIMCTGRS